MRTRTLLVAGLALSLAAAGCVGELDDAGPGESSNGAQDGPTTTWSYDRANGTVTGATTPAGSVNQGGETTATFEVPENARVLYLNVTTEGGEVNWQYGPDCQTDPSIQCENSSSTSDGSDEQVLQVPAPGTWEAHFFVGDDTTAGEVDWTLDVAVGVLTQG